jgi:collagenase-like PrtC family protease
MTVNLIPMGTLALADLASQKGFKTKILHLKLLRPAELIKARWIRPEDVGDYEGMGIDCLKLVERFRGTESLIHIVRAYERKSYQGNLVELLSLPQQGAFLTPNLEGACVIKVGFRY